MSEEFSIPITVSAGFLKSEFDRVLNIASKLGASDVSIQSDDFIVFMISGIQRRASNRIIQHHEVEGIVNVLYEGANGVAQISQGNPIDKRYQIKPSRGETIGFRVHILPARINGNNKALSVTMRVLPQNPPSIYDMKLPKEIALNCLPRNGLITISGVTSSGKSTTIASILRYAYELRSDSAITACGRKIGTYEAPIEYIYDNIDALAPKIAQTEIGGKESSIGTWGEAIQTAMRRALSIILIGECRDHSTMDGCIESANTGHATLTTLHAGSVGGSFRRMVALGTAQEMSVGAVTEKLLGAIKLMITQALSPKIGGGRVAIIEWLLITQSFADKLFDLPPDQIARELQRECVRRGTSLGHSALYHYKKGNITLFNACSFSGLTKSELLALTLDESVFNPFVMGDDKVVLEDEKNAA